LTDHGAFNRETGGGVFARLPESASVRVPVRNIPRVAARIGPRSPHAARVGDVRTRLLDSAALLLGAPDRRVSLLLLLNMRMSGYFRRRQRGGSDQAR